MEHVSANQSSSTRPGSFPFITLTVIALAAFVGRDHLHLPAEGPTPTLATDEITVIRTPGGMLEVSTLIRNEEFGWSTRHTCPVIDCGAFLGATVSEVRVPVHYTYRIRLAPTWTLRLRDGHYRITVPREESNLPPGIDFTRMQIRTTRRWLSPSSQENRASLLRHLGPELDARAARPEYIAAQREEARKTVAEFARKWMVEQGTGGRTEYPIRVHFEGESK